MALEQRLESLKKRHHNIDIELRSEEARPAPDDAVLHKLKLQKLSLKDEISRLSQSFQKQAA